MNIIIKKLFMEARMCDSGQGLLCLDAVQGAGKAARETYKTYVSKTLGPRNAEMRQTVQSGYIALMAVLITGLIAVSITTSLLLFGTSETKTAITREESERARAYANACAEEALQQIRSSTGFTGSGSLTFGADSCSYTVTGLGGENREITATGAVNTVVRKVKAVVSDINPQILVSSWQEVADF
mgnify:CR=1 FL=1